MCQPVCCKYCSLGGTLRSGAGVTAEAQKDRVQASRNSRAVERQETSKPTEPFQTLDAERGNEEGQREWIWVGGLLFRGNL